MVSRFREIVRDDMRKVFLNKDELAKTVIWNGYPLDIVEHANVEIEQYETQGIFRQLRRLTFHELDLMPHPVVNEEPTIDGEKWQVVDVFPLFGRVEVIITRAD